MKKLYYTNRVTEFAKDSKKLWNLINDIIKKIKHKGNIIPYITINGMKTSNPVKIANEFGKFYSTLGATLASKISNGKQCVNDYINKIPRNCSSLVMQCTTIEEIQKTITSLPNKTSHRHDGISNELLKKLNQSISFPLCLIFNKLIEQGIFPKQMIIAEVITLYKGKKHDIVINNRPISLLITVSKLLEKIVYTRVYSFSEKHNILYNSQYSFCNKHSCEHALMELCGKVIRAKDQGQHSTALFLDLLKASDMLNHMVLLKKLE